MKKKTTVLLASTLTVSMLLGVAATANADSLGNLVTPVVNALTAAASPRAAAPTGTWFEAGGKRVSEFDPTQGLDVDSTDYPDAAWWDVTGKVQIHDVPAGWSVSCDMRVNNATGKWSAFYILKNGTETYRWYFQGADDIIHTVDELRDVRLTINGVEQTGYDPTKDVEIHNVYTTSVLGFTGWPGETWTVTQGVYGDNEGYQYVFKPKNADTPQVTYKFVYDVPDPQNELGQVIARLDDGSLVTGFEGDNLNKAYNIPENHTVHLENLPDGWKVTNTYGNDTVTRIELTKTGSAGTYTYQFPIVPESSYTWTYDINQLKDIKLELSGGRTVENFDWRGGQFTIPYDYGMVSYSNVPEGWHVSSVSEEAGPRVTVTSPDGKVTVEYMLSVERPPQALTDLANVTAYADGKKIEKFNPMTSGTWTVPNGSEILLDGLPSEGWVTVHDDGTLTWKMVSTDGKLTVTWTFQYGTQSTSELAGVTATTNTGAPVENFDPVKGGLFNVPEGTTGVTLSNVPSNWTSTPMSDGRIGYTLTSQDGSLTVEYTFLPPAQKQHTVTFDMNGGTGSETLQYVVDGENVRKPADPTRPGYRFDGWTLNGEAYTFTTPVTEDITLQAQWTQVYTITFDYGYESKTNTVQLADGELLEKPADLVREGYKFLGWKLPNGGPDYYDQWGQPVKNSMTLYAEWGQSETHTVTFTDPEGGTSTASQQVEDGQKAEIPVEPKREGYKFTGWLREDGRAYDFDQPVKADITLHAGWKAIEYNVTFSTMGGTPTIPTQKVPYNGKVTDPKQPTREGYRFTGWYTDTACTQKYDFNTIVTRNMSLFAGWEEIKPTPISYTVKFDSDGGTTYPDQKVESGDTATYPGTPVKEGYTFVQWFLNGEPYDFDTPVTGDITLEAVWKANKVTHTVTFDTGTGTPSTVTVEDGHTVDKPADPEREGYTFNGWMLDGNPYDFTQKVTGDLTLTASWTPLPVIHTVTVDPNNGQPASEYKVQDGSVFAQPITPTYAGHTFKGWTLNGTPYDFTQKVTGDITLVAQWAQDEPTPVTYTVTFDSNGGSSVDKQTVNAGDKAVKPADPTREGYTFTGWYRNGSLFDFNTPINTNMTLTAQWEQHVTIDELADVKAIVNGEELKGFEPTRDGTYKIPNGSNVLITGVPDDWEIVSHPSGSSVTFTVTDGDRSVSYTFTYDGSATTDPDEPTGPTDPDNPGTDPDQPTDPDKPDTGDPDKPTDPDKPNTGGDTDKPDTDNPQTPGQTDGNQTGDGQTDAADNGQQANGNDLAQTGVSPIGVVVISIAAVIAAIVAGAGVILRKRFRKNDDDPADATPSDDTPEPSADTSEIPTVKPTAGE